MAGRKARLRKPGRLSRKNRAGAVFCQSRAAHKNAGSAPIKALSCAGNEPQRCVRRRLRSVSSTPPRYAAAPCFGFTVAAPRQTACGAAPPTTCHHSSAPNRSRAGHTVARLERVRTAATLEGSGARNRFGRAVAFILPLLANRPRAAELLHACELSSVRHVELHYTLQGQIPVCFLCDGRTGAQPPSICGLLCVNHDSNHRTTPGDRARN